MIVIVDLLAGCDAISCRQFAAEEHALLAVPQYSQGASVRSLLEEEPFVRLKTARTRSAAAQRAGFYVATFEPATRFDDMLAINRSAPVRQGRPMDRTYFDLTPSTSLIGPPPCPSHSIQMWGVFSKTGRLVGYAGIYRCGGLVHVSQFLGHAEFLDYGIMYLLMDAIITEHSDTGATALFYNRHDSGTDGLRFFKERIGLTSQDVTWRL